jgi:integrase
MQERRLSPSQDDLREFARGLKTDRTVNGVRSQKSEKLLLQEARRKLANRSACSLVPNYSLYALRHAWATHALQRGVDPLTVAILMGHRDPSMLARVYQHLSLNPNHLLQQARKAVG